MASLQDLFNKNNIVTSQRQGLLFIKVKFGDNIVLTGKNKVRNIKKYWVQLTPDIKNIKHVERHIKEFFGISSAIKLRIDGCDLDPRIPAQLIAQAELEVLRDSGIEEIVSEITNGFEAMDVDEPNYGDHDVQTSTPNSSHPVIFSPGESIVVSSPDKSKVQILGPAVENTIRQSEVEEEPTGNDSNFLVRCIKNGQDLDLSRQEEAASSPAIDQSIINSWGVISPRATKESLDLTEKIESGQSPEMSFGASKDLSHKTLNEIERNSDSKKKKKKKEEDGNCESAENTEFVDLSRDQDEKNSGIDEVDDGEKLPKQPSMEYPENACVTCFFNDKEECGCFDQINLDSEEETIGVSAVTQDSVLDSHDANTN